MQNSRTARLTWSAFARTLANPRRPDFVRAAVSPSASHASAPSASHSSAFFSAALLVGVLALSSTTRAAATNAGTSYSTTYSTTYSAAAVAAQAKAGATDQIYVRAKDGSVAPVSGVVTKDELDKVSATVGGKDSNFDAKLVVRVAWGDIPASLRDGRSSAERGDFEAAVAALRSAAGDSAARDVVKAAARLELVDALIAWGAKDPARFVEATTEAQTFLTSYPTNRQTPRARALLGRAQWLSGKAAEGAATLKALWSELKGAEATQGYDVRGCLEAGRDAARAFLEAKDTLAARELFLTLESQAGPLAVGAADDDPLKAFYQSITDESALGAGFVDLAAGQAKQALNFFQNKVNGLGAASSLTARYGAQLGLGEALLAEGKLREASMALGRAAALDPEDPDRSARALVRLAECYSKLPDADARTQACSRLKTVLNTAGATPAAARARQLQKDLGC